METDKKFALPSLFSGPPAVKGNPEKMRFITFVLSVPFAIGGFLFFSIAGVQAATYYVSNGATGSWAGATNRSTPTSYTTANANAKAGDTVVFIKDGGTFQPTTTFINPANNGASEVNRIIFKGESATSKTEVLLYTAGSYASCGANVANKSYITIENFIFYRRGYSWITGRNEDFSPVTYTTGITIQNNEFYVHPSYFNIRASGGGIVIGGGLSNIKILNNIIGNTYGSNASPDDLIRVNSNINTPSSNVLIEGNTLLGGNHMCIAAGGYGTYTKVIIRNNIISNPNHTGFSTFRRSYDTYQETPQLFLVENNTVYNCGSACSTDSCPENEWGTTGTTGDQNRPREHHPGHQMGIQNSIIRRNLYYHNGSGVNIGSAINRNNRIYHNTLANNCVAISSNVASGEINGNVIKNNIFAYNSKTPSSSAYNGEVMIYHTPSPCFNVYDTNSIDRPELDMLRFGTCSYSVGNRTLANTIALAPNEWLSNNKRRAAGFINAGQNDYRLAESSLLIDAGNWLTRTSGSGSNSNKLVVLDARYFMDGWDMIEGDLIQLQGQTTPVRITSVNYDTNTLTLDRNLSWSANQGVALTYSGAAPDIGAFEYEGTSVAKKGDLNGDNKVNVIDLGILLSNWGKTTKPPSDLNQNGTVDVVDLGILLGNWGN